MFIPDVYKDVSYVLDDDTYAAAELNDIIRKRFVKAWEGLVEGYKVRRCPQYHLNAMLIALLRRTRSPRATSGYSLAWP